MSLTRRIYNAFLTLLFGVFAYPMFAMGGYFLVCWYRSHTSDVYYMEFSYFTAAMAWMGIGLISLLCTLYGAWRRSFYRVLFVVPVFLAVAAGAIIPSVGMPPRATDGRITDINYICKVSSFLGVWSDENSRFPGNDLEYQEAMVKGPAAWQDRVSLAPESPYRQHGRALPYEVVIATNATGARTNDVSTRPGVVYYCVSADMQEYWVTMTALDTDVGAFAKLKTSVLSKDNYLMFHAHYKGAKKGI